MTFANNLRTLVFGYTFLALALVGNAGAAVYYVDSNAGNDAQDGLTELTAWRTIQRVNDSSLSPGDSILLKRNGFWREGLQIRNDGITVDAYGAGTAPTLSGAVAIGSATWTRHNGNIYSSHVGVITQPTQLYVDGVYYEIARYPDTGFRLTTSSSSNSSTFNDAALTPLGDLIGATLVARSADWRFDSLTVTGFNNGTITTGSGLFANRTMPKGYGYILKNKLWMLDRAKEWYYDSAAGNLYLWTSAGDNPANHVVEISQVNHVIESTGRQNVTIRNLTVTRANTHNITLNGGSNHRLERLSLSGGNLGLYLRSDNSSVQYVRVNGTLWGGMYISGSVNTVRNNVIENSGTIDLPIIDNNVLYKVALWPFGGVGLRLSGGRGNVVSDNAITDSGWNGIFFYGQATIERNRVDRSLLRLTDGGGIYFWSALSKGSKVRYNKVARVTGNAEGADQPKTMGIYADGVESVPVDIEMEENEVDGAIYGIFLHNGYATRILRNRVSNASYPLAIYYDRPLSPSYRETANDHFVFGNIFASISSDTYPNPAAYYMLNSQRDYSSIGTTNNNLYCSSAEGAGFYKQSPSRVERFNLAGWRAASGQDAESQEIIGSCSSTTPLPVVTPTVNLATPTSPAPISLRWTTYNADVCTASGDWSGVKGSSGTEIVQTPQHGSFTLSCSNSAGTISKTVHLSPVRP